MRPSRMSKHDDFGSIEKRERGQYPYPCRPIRRHKQNKLNHWLLVALLLLPHWLCSATIIKSSSSSTTSRNQTTQHDTTTTSRTAVVRGGMVLATAARQSLSHSLRVGLAGGIAGAVGTAVLYPVDTAKTLRQANPTRYASVRHALMDLIFPSSASPATSQTSSLLSPPTPLPHAHTQPHHELARSIRIQKAYRGVLPATLGAIPSSALYFGAYETCKIIISNRLLHKRRQQQQSQSQSQPQDYFAFPTRLLIHSLAAASGNCLSSLIFVPKEFWKQQLQCFPEQKVWGVVRETCSKYGWRGMYAGYQATLLRNVPSAILRFAMYEELKYHFATTNNNNEKNGWSPRFFAAGAVAGAVASGCLTPVDVVKTRLATHTLPATNGGLLASAKYIVQESGVAGLYAGAGSRMVWSGAFSAIGFGTFEWAKSLLGVQQQQQQQQQRKDDDANDTNDGMQRNRVGRNSKRKR